MKIDFKGLMEGVKNSVFINQEVEKVAAERIAICRACPLNSKNVKNIGRLDEYCTDCGCNLHFKTRCLSCSCPKDKWVAILSDKEDEELQQKLKDGQTDNN